MKFSLSTLAVAFALLVTDPCQAFHGCAGGCGGQAGFAQPSGCGYGVGLWEGFCAGGHGGLRKGCSGGAGCDKCCCPPSSSYVGWWYGGAPGCGVGCIKGHNCGTLNSYGWGAHGGFTQVGYGTGWQGGGGIFGGLFQRRHQPCCDGWVGGGVLDAYNVGQNFGPAGVDYGSMNQWHPAANGTHGNDGPSAASDYPAIGQGANGQAGANGTGDAVFENESFGVPQAPNFLD